MTDEGHRFVVYGLCEPTTGEIRYVGKTNNLKKRYADHCRCSLTSERLDRWLRRLARRGTSPLLAVLAEAESERDCDKLETHYVLQLRRPRLLNSTRGIHYSPVACLPGQVANPDARLPRKKTTRPIGTKIRAMRRAKKWTQLELAERSGGILRRTEVIKIEKGTNGGRTFRVRHGLARAFGMSVDELSAELDAEKAEAG